MKEKKQELKPEIIEAGKDEDINQLENFNKALQNSEIQSTESSSSGSFFRSVLKQFFSKENISMKTEYLNVQENYTGAKLSFLAKELKMKYLLDFIEIFETKRVSLERKGRKELLMSIQERNKEIEEQRTSQLRSMFGMG